MTEVEIRPPLAARVYAAVFSTLWCGAVVVGGVRGLLAGSLAALVTVPMLALGATFGYRLVRMGVRGERDTLTIRNSWSTRTLRRADIEDFRTGTGITGGLPGSRVVQVLLRDRTVLPLDVTSTPLPLPRGRARLQQRLEQLQAWHRG